MQIIRHWLRTGSPLGSGAFGHVSLAIDLDNSTLFAVKSATSFISSSLAATDIDCPQFRALENELQILQSLDSPTVLRCFGSDYSTSEENASVSCNLFLEYMDRGSLADLIKKSGGRLGDQDVQHYTRAILEGLSYLHDNGIVHCDIKAENILLGSSGSVKIGDFGCAQRSSLVVEEEVPRGAASTHGALRGTPMWMAPEVVRRVEQQPPSDIWSLGCTVVQMLQGRPPWGHLAEVAAVLYKVACTREEPPLPEGLSQEARDFLHQCLQRDPKARSTAAQLLQHPFVCNLDKAADIKALAVSSPNRVLDWGVVHEADDSSSTASHVQSATLSELSVQQPLQKRLAAHHHSPVSATSIRTQDRKLWNIPDGEFGCSNRSGDQDYYSLVPSCNMKKRKRVG